MSEYVVGAKVYKPRGYEYPGTVVSVFQNLEGQTRLVVESLRTPRMLHIFAPEQVFCVPVEEPCHKCHHAWKDHEKEIKLSKELTLQECHINMGMGDWCGCKNRIPAGVMAANDKVWK